MKLPFWATTLTLLGVLILCSLGTWQLYRLEWKTELLQTIESEYAKDASSILIAPEKLNETLNMTRGSIKGRFLHDKAIAISPRTHEGEPGYHILTPLKTVSGTHILINRGWVPLDKKETYSRSNGTQTITGLFRTPGRPNIFVPKNTPEKDQWHRIDLAQISSEKGLEPLAPVILYAENEDESLPMATAIKPKPNNNHLQYALFWYAMACALIGVYWLRFIKKNS